MDWVVWVLVGAMVILVGAAYLAGRTRAGQALAGRSMKVVLSTEVREVMSTPPRVVREETTIEEAARVMLDQGIGCLPVVRADGGMVGIVTESDLTGGRPWLALRPGGRSEIAEGTRPEGPDLESLRTPRVGGGMTR